jgi:hypothetical protein
LEALDPGVISDSIPAFFIGRDKSGFWVAREAKGRIGGLFLLKSSALAFAHAQGGRAGCATIFPHQRFELDLENEGNALAGRLARLVRAITGYRERIERARRLARRRLKRARILPARSNSPYSPVLCLSLLLTVGLFILGH